MIRAAIIDDEKPARQELAYYLREFSDFEIVGEAENGEDALRLVHRERPDLLFLDIQMPGKDGFQVAENLLGDPAIPLIVFVTAYDKYALRAFEIHAFDYLLKPVEEKRLTKCVKKIRAQFAAGHATRHDIAALLETLQERKEPASEQIVKQITVRRGSRIIPLDVEEIHFFSVENGIVYAYPEEGRRTTTLQSLEKVERLLNPDLFFRAHRNFLVNIRKIREIHPLPNQTYTLRMEGTEEKDVPLSRQQAKKLRKILRF